jgi:hypothetical protein
MSYWHGHVSNHFAYLLDDPYLDLNQGVLTMLENQTMSPVSIGNWFSPVSWFAWLESSIFPIMSGVLVAGFFLLNEKMSTFSAVYSAEATSEAGIYYALVLNILLYLSAFIAVVGVIESIVRTFRDKTEWSDILKLVVALTVMYLGMQQLNLVWMALAYSVGFMLARSAAHSGSYDFTPLVAFNAAAAGMLLASGHLWFWALPLVIAALYQVVEIIRLHDWYIVIAGAVFTLFAIAVVALTMNPVIWLVILVAIFVIVIPTIIGEVVRRFSVGGSLMNSFKSLPGEEWLCRIQLSFDMATATGVVVMLLLFVSMLIWG